MGWRVAPLACVAAAVVALVAGCGAKPPREDSPQEVLSKVTGDELYQRGMYFANKGDSIRAEQYLTAAMKAGVPKTKAVPPLVQVMVRVSRLRNALKHALPYLELQPKDWRLRQVVVSLYLGLEDLDEATKHAERVVRDAPDSPMGHYLRAVIARDQGDVPTARAHFEQYLALEKQGPHAQEAVAYLAEHPPEPSVPAPPADESSQPKGDSASEGS